MKSPDRPANPAPAPTPAPAQFLLNEQDLIAFSQGRLFRAHDHFGAHRITRDHRTGVRFAVWAPNAQSVSVIGDWNQWNPRKHPMNRREPFGVWELFIPNVPAGGLYKFHIVSQWNDYTVDKSDPYARYAEFRPGTASIVWDAPYYPWTDKAWMQARRENSSLLNPMSIYEIHLGSWMRVPEEDHRWLNYRELAPKLADYVIDMGFTHVELLPIAEHPFDGSWGYQVSNYYAPTSRFGTPDDFRYFVDTLHKAGIGVILDWVPAHFPHDAHALGFFDGTHLYEHADPRQGVHRDWDTLIFNYAVPQVLSFLISNALYWIDQFHIDGLRVDAVASMLYLDYSRPQGEWVANLFGGRENLDAISFLRSLNETVYRDFPDSFTIAEESTAWPMVSRPTYLGGLGFGYKWDMGWMHDTLQFLGMDPVYRKYHQHELTFRNMYAFTENFVLALSHDEVVHGKRSLLNKLPGDLWQQFATLRLLYGLQFGQPGKKLIFMGSEFAQCGEWNHDSSLDWDLLQLPLHRGIQFWVRDLNYAYRRVRAFHELDCDPNGFQWIDCHDSHQNILSFYRRGKIDAPPCIFVYNLTPIPRDHYLIGVNEPGLWKEILNSDSTLYGGSGMGNMGQTRTIGAPQHGLPHSLELTLPPLSLLVFQHMR